VNVLKKLLRNLNQMRRTTIFKQLIYNVVIPVVIALLLLGILNLLNTRNNLVKSNNEKNYFISDEITHVLGFQDLALGILETNLNNKFEVYSNTLVNDIFADSRNIETVDLYQIQRDIGMNPDFEDLYIINRNGIVVNTTFEDNLNRNFFDFGEEYKDFLLGVFDNKEFVSDIFTIEDVTKRIRKYSYQPSLCGKYIIEIGIYSEKADEIIEIINTRKEGISEKAEGISSVDLFIFTGQENWFSWTPSTVKDDHNPVLLKAFKDKSTETIVEKENNKRIHYEYIYMERENSGLYIGSVIRIVADRSAEDRLYRTELLKFLLILGFTLSVVISLIYRKTRVITDPIKKLVENVNRITNGHLNERAEVIGNNEITKLSEHFNDMIAELESYYHELEEKVRQRTAEIMRQKEKIEEQNKHIMDSIYYAKRIQNAILPPDSYVHELLPESFILYKPKDIVSGDFYWLTKKDKFVMVAAVDCTGHGVPGAFMSIVGNNQLNYAVNVKKARTSAKILDELNKGVTNTLREKSGTSSVKDGMDIALCTINNETNTLDFSGAFNPLIQIRNNEVEIIKPDKFPIGAFIEDELQKFTSHEIKLKKGDVYYIFSDGYPDQFGGPDNRKFFAKRFRELLHEIHKKPMTEQKEILDKTIEDWKGDKEQIDDILVIGIRV